jgi:Transglutaminase-like superfamily
MVARHALTTLSIWLTLSASACAQRLPPEVTVSNPRVFDVTITTTFVVPTNGKTLKHLGVWHALPTARPWDGLDRTLGASAITCQPEAGRVRHLASNESQSVFWEWHEHLKPGQKLEFVSRFRVRSADRNFDYQRSIARWSDYYQRIGETPLHVDSELTSIVDEIKKLHAPVEAALEFCKWIARSIKYDASVPYGPRDLTATLKYKKGHCGHEMTLFEAMCTRAGIPTRPAVGLNLSAPSGIGSLHKIRPDFENQHTWAQIYLPGSGWIEIDPSAGPNAYAIPAQLIQNNSDFQNYAIWISEDGGWKQPDWEYRNGKWFSPYGVENRRSFRKVE